MSSDDNNIIVSPTSRDADASPSTTATATASNSATSGTNPSSSPPVAPVPLSWPVDGELSLEWIHNLMSAFEWSSRNLPPSAFPTVFPVAVFDALVLTASKILHKEPNCLQIETFDSDSAVVVVGDLHGQLHDVLFLLKDAGFPAQDRIFVFNGDYVDRGAWGLETFLLLLAWKVLKYLILFYQRIHFWHVLQSTWISSSIASSFMQFVNGTSSIKLISWSMLKTPKSCFHLSQMKLIYFPQLDWILVIGRVRLNIYHFGN